MSDSSGTYPLRSPGRNTLEGLLQEWTSEADPGSVEDYFAGAPQKPPRSAALPVPRTPSQPSEAWGRTPQPVSDLELRYVFACAIVGPALAVAWSVTGRPNWFWPALFWVPDVCIALVALMAPAGRRMHRFAVGVSGAFVAGGTARAAVALFALAEGRHPGAWTKQLAFGLFAAAFFGGGNLLGRRLWRPERTLSEDVAARITPPLKGQRSRRVWLTLGDGRRVPAAVAYRRQLVKLPSGVDARNVVDAQDR